MPYYLERFDDRVPLAENILSHILRRDGFLHEEAEQRELDAVALDHLAGVLAVGTCKWTAAAIGLAEEALLTRLQAHVPGVAASPRHYFYARSGFEEPLRRLCSADPERYRLLAPADLYA